MPLWSEQVSDIECYGAGCLPRHEPGVQGSAHLRVLNAPDEGNGKRVAIADACCGLAATVGLIPLLEAIDAGGALGRAELGGVFLVGGAAFVHVLGDPAFVADVAVAASLVEGGEDALDLG
jgi:hypothetical protein